MKNITFFVSTIIALLLVSLYFNAKYFTLKEQNHTLEVPISTMKSIDGVMADQLNAWNNGDHEGFMNGYWKSDSLKFITSKGVKYGWNNVLNMYKTNYPSKAEMGKLIFHRDGIYTMSDKTQEVLLVGRWEVQKEDTNSGTFSLVFKNFSGNWKIVEDHTYN